ncbi:hypothetical protein PSPO01_12218 [Paraphaeosphaeria sporulosa]
MQARKDRVATNGGRSQVWCVSTTGSVIFLLVQCVLGSFRDMAAMWLRIQAGLQRAHGAQQAPSARLHAPYRPSVYAKPDGDLPNGSGERRVWFADYQRCGCGCPECGE